MPHRVAIVIKSYRLARLVMTPEERLEYIATRSAIILAQLKEVRALREQLRQAQAAARQLNIQEIRTISKD